ncbi:tRNA lysidine(34) synthetase TilS [Candidatus Peregrinibacteria bacterium CG11_big_fil_rev_8_21_14_0_20_46_8]|nr:MAG: tRNA lysidine(34) synthetase TilS [Candidatus Peregrinibacteria bacterium CG11_big_fil_rev_8_21_14_0_20_46_8]
MKKVATILEKYLGPGETVIVGVSGGPDSIALLNYVYTFAQANNCTIVVAHVHHGLRGKEADEDLEFVQKIAENRGQQFESIRAQLSGSSVEVKGRKLRYEFFEKLRQKYSARYIITAHHADDQLETILFNFIRGCGPTGLGGMEIEENGILRPMLEIRKQEILKYLKQHSLEYRTDSTNDSLIYTRNFLRHEVVPRCEMINPAFTETVLRNSVIFNEFDQWLRNEAQKFLDKKLEFTLQQYVQLPRALKLAVIQEVYRSGKKSHYALPIKKVFEVEKLLERNIGNKKIRCGGGGVFYLNKGVVRFEAA